MSTPTAVTPNQPPGLGADDTALLVPIAELVAYPGNPRRGRVDLIAQSLQENRQYRPIVANRGTHTGRPGEVLAGNHTLAAAERLGWTRIAVVWVDVDNDRARRIMLSDNRTSDTSVYEDRELAAQLLALDGDYAGTGYGVHDVDAIAAAIRDAEPRALPTGPQPGLRSDRTRVITCPHCGDQFDATSAVEVRSPHDAGGRA